jgi:hypothetical protein
VNGKTLTVFPLVTGTNASGGSIENQDVYNVPFIQYQAGNSSVKMTPRVGDIGLVIACDKDITNVKKLKAEALHQLSGATHTRMLFTSRL